MTFDVIVTQGHVPDFDPQGSLSADQKVEMFDASLKHLRQNNPDSYIILCGHGRRPGASSLCDHVYWEDECRLLDRNGYLVGMPAQFFLYLKGFSTQLTKGLLKC